MRLYICLIMVIAFSGCAQIGGKTPRENVVSTTKTLDVADNEIIRIVTPFQDPRVITTSDAEIQQSQHVLYVLPNGQERIAMFVTDAENEAQSISLTLHPKPSGVREIDVLAIENEAQEKVSAPASATIKPAVKAAAATKKTSGRKVEPWDPRRCTLCRDPDDNGSSDYSGKSW